MNKKLRWAAPEKRSAAQALAGVLTIEVFTALEIPISSALIKLNENIEIKSIKLFAAPYNPEGYYTKDSLPLPEERASPQHLKERIISACVHDDILKLILQDAKSLAAIPAALIIIIDRFLADEMKLTINHQWSLVEFSTFHDKHKSPLDNNRDKKNPSPHIYWDIPYCKQYKISNFWHDDSQKHQLIKGSGFFNSYETIKIHKIPFHPRLLLNQAPLPDQDIINYTARLFQRSSISLNNSVTKLARGHLRIQLDFSSSYCWNDGR